MNNRRNKMPCTCAILDDENFQPDHEAAPDGWVCTACGGRFKGPRWQHPRNEVYILNDITTCVALANDALKKNDKRELFINMMSLYSFTREWHTYYVPKPPKEVEVCLDCM